MRGAVDSPAAGVAAPGRSSMVYGRTQGAGNVSASLVP
jgi:hypothetical protein